MTILRGYQLNSPLVAAHGKALHRGVELHSGRQVIVYITTDRKSVEVFDYTFAAHDQVHKHPYQVERQDGAYALIYEDLGERCLVEYIHAGKLDWSDFLSIASECAATVAALHASGHTNLQITPDQLWVHPDSGRVTLLSLPRSNDLPFVDLAYFSPEQLGWNPLPVDHRSDLYTLGVIFYEWLSGRRPFEANSPAEWAHAHRVAKPESVSRHNSRIPSVIAGIIMTLLSKQADDRYQTARGLHYDLSVCREALLQTGEVADFALKSRDEPGVLRNRQVFYGREAELEELMSAHARAAEGPSEFWVVKGPAGCGKSAMLQEFGRRLSDTGAWFAYRKCEENPNENLLGPIADVIKDLVRRVLSGPSGEVQRYKERLQKLASQGVV